MTRSISWRLCLAALLVSSMATTAWAQAPVPAPVPAPAPGPANDAALASRFADAQKAFDAGRFEEALQGFQSLVDETKSPNAMLYVARSLRSLKRLPEAHDAMRATAREATARAATEAKYASTRDAAASELALLAVEVGFVVIAIADAPEGAEVTLDGVPLSNDRLGSPITVVPGTHAVELRIASASPVQRSLNVGAGETKTLALAAGAAAAPTAPPTRQPPAEETSSGGGLRVAGFVVGGVGLASLGVGVLTGVLANGEFSELEDTCGSARCTDPAAADTIDSGKTLETVANVTLIGGALLVAAAVPLIVFGGPSESGTAALSVGPGGASMRWSTSF
jgi:hypothetical protein